MTSVDWLVLAVVVDSLVTMVVGWRLSRVARRETEKAAETVRPAIVDEVQKAIAMLLPVVAARVAQAVQPLPPPPPPVQRPELKAIEKD